MKKMKFLVSLILGVSLLGVQAGSAFGAPALQGSNVLAGTIQSITLETDTNTGITTVIVELRAADKTRQTLRISQTAATTAGLLAIDGDGNPLINKSALGKLVEIDPVTVLPDPPEDRNPIGEALATFFSEVPGLNYETVMSARQKGAGFSTIAQALWLTKRLQGNSEIFKALMVARETGDYSAFAFDGVTPQNWGQLRKAIMDGKKLDKTGNQAANQNNGYDGDDKDKNPNK